MNSSPLPGKISHLFRRGLVALFAILVVLSGCSSIKRSHGYMPPDDVVATLIIGTDTQQTVSAKIGTPTAVDTLDQRAWYYVKSQWVTIGPFTPKETSRDILAIHFKNNILENIARYDLENGQIIPISRRITDSSVDDISFLRRLFGNIGRLDPAQLVTD